AIGQYSEFGGFRAHGSERALRIAQLDGVMILGAEPVGEYERGHSERVEPVRHLAAFVVGREMAISAAGTNHDARAVGLILHRQKDGERGLVGVVVSQGAGRAVRPERNRGWFLSERDSRDQAEQQDSHRFLIVGYGVS